MFGGLIGIFIIIIIIPIRLYPSIATERYHQWGIHPDENILIFLLYRSGSKFQVLLIQIPDSIPHLGRLTKKNCDRLTHHSLSPVGLIEHTQWPGRARGG